MLYSLVVRLMGLGHVKMWLFLMYIVIRLTCTQITSASNYKCMCVLN